ncbi:carboxypeptidase-like regulatory domain-containing protein [Psychroserpens ponticola]|uniref:Carboxypeptidase-like regulatory domain-containing protein n=1 Tax=Psychroserpens ponticola TaxID=2932268 RepID=A0ABY7RVP6_9FLAO|nr:carboxypeptidase-like regulatory domain-containing protein [Psychroserpens ponticola]WCO01053.1 carboxypeptidase-like regulatory domain-containing protein [Psychroserpens ponticola]
MKTTKCISFLFIAFLISFLGISQTIDLKGQINASAELEGIHILNISAEEYTITNSKGVFEIPIQINDTILVSSVQYLKKSIVVTQEIFESKFISIQLKDRVNELDEVIVGKVLTGDLMSDIKNSDAKADINFYDVGIPGYTGKPKTQKERRLHEADAGKFVYYYGLIATINIHKVLNRISGRTKKLKLLVRLEEQDACMNKAIAEFSDDLFGHIELKEELKTEFFYFASEDSKFLEVCKLESDIKLFEFLIEKLLAFNIQISED